jgi:translation initiation factor 1
MARRKKSGKKATGGSSSGGKAKLAHHPFGSLGALREQLPASDADSDSPEHQATTVEPDEAPPALRFAKKLVVRMEKKGRRGKTVTRISGLPMGELKALAVEMKRAMGCGAMVEGAELILQGSLVDRAVAWLDKQGAAQIVKGN